MKYPFIILAALSMPTVAALAEEGEKKKPPFADGTATPAPGAEGEKKGPPFADSGKKAAAKPEARTWNVIQKGDVKLAFAAEMKPGVPDPQQLTEIMLTASAIPARPDPVFGSQVPLEGARIIVEIMNPAGQLVGRYLTHPIPFAKGRFGLHFTPSQEGIYTLGIRGKTQKGEAINAEVKLPVKVWPLPPELEGTGEKAEGGGRRGPITGN